MAGHHKLRRNDEVVIHPLNNAEPPYFIRGKYLGEDEDNIRIEGTVGDFIGHDIFIPKTNIKMIERIAERPVREDY